MQISITDPVHQTIVFGAVLGTIFLLSYWKKKNYTALSLTQELKGFAILAIIFAHIGYGLASGTNFLFPLSILAGVGVNLFLFLSGYGLTFSALSKDESRVSFYTRRLPRLYIPFWVVVGILFLLDHFLTYGNYSFSYIAQSFAGVFTNANMYSDINSPLWYFTMILFYYLLFPLVFFKRYAWATASLLYAAIWSVVHFNPAPLAGVLGLYEVHMLAFPLGVFGAWLVKSGKLTLTMPIQKIYHKLHLVLYPTIMIALGAAIWYLAIHANIGKLAAIEERTSIITMFAVISFFALKKRESKLFTLFGFYSYEIYLFHWPLLWRYDILYTHLPAWIATVAYLGLFIALAHLLKKVVAAI
jgi:peptidoglycan/LPS O-acetylase OafA/YrhL